MGDYVQVENGRPIAISGDADSLAKWASPLIEDQCRGDGVVVAWVLAVYLGRNDPSPADGRGVASEDPIDSFALKLGRLVAAKRVWRWGGVTRFRVGPSINKSGLSCENIEWLARISRCLLYTSDAADE